MQDKGAQPCCMFHRTTVCIPDTSVNMLRYDHFRSRTRRHRVTVRSRRLRSGVLTLEMILTLPILLVVGLAIVQFSMMLMGSQAVSAAAHAGVRAAALPGSSNASVVATVHRALESRSFQNDVNVLILVNDKTELAKPLITATTGDKVSVTVSVNATKVAPNALRLIGISLTDTELHQTFVMRKE